METTSRRRFGASQVLGAALLVLGFGLLLDQAGVITFSTNVLLSVVLVIVGLGLIAVPISRYTGLVVLGVGLTVVLAASNFDFPRRGGVGETAVTVLSPAELRPQYSLVAGSFLLDLSEVDLGPAREALDVEVSVGLGELVVIVPDGLGVEAEVEVGTGQLHFLGDEIGEGSGISQTLHSEDFERARHRIELRLDMGAGSVEVRRADP